MKLKNILVAAASLAATLPASAQLPPETDWPAELPVNRPFTRWWWMGSAVDKENLTYNLGEYSKAGIGGVEITPIYGVQNNEHREIQYLSPEWIDVYKYTVAEASRLGMSVDLNNSTGWPFGGPEVTIDDAATRSLIYVYDLEDRTAWTAPIAVEEEKQADYAVLRRVMAYGPDGERIDVTENVDQEAILNWIAPGAGWKLYVIFTGKTLQKVKRNAPGGEGYVFDHFKRDALEKFLGRIDKAFAEGDAPMPRMFFNDSYEVYGANWSDELLEEFEARRGYKLEDHLDDFLRVPKDEMAKRVVSDYRQTIHEMLMDNFITPWIDWAHSHGSRIRNQSHGSPGNILDIYASVDVPECETFGRSPFDIPVLREDSILKFNDAPPPVLKFASSAAHITGKKLTSAETFTWLTEHFRTSLAHCKPEIDQMFTSGVNHVFFHGTTYSPKEEEWPGWLFYASINMSPTNPFWTDAPAFFKYITRTQSFLQSGQPDNDFLLYVPIYDFWHDIRNNNNPFLTFPIHGLENKIPEFTRTVTEIMNLGYDVDYISDKFIATLEVENDQLVTEGGVRYKALIIPGSRLMEPETLNKLVDLAEAGATIIFKDRYPEDVPGLSKLSSRRNRFQEAYGRLPLVDFESIELKVMGTGYGEIITGNDLEGVLKPTRVKPEPFVSEIGGQLIRRSYDAPGLLGHIPEGVVLAHGHIYFMSLLKDRPVDEWVELAVDAQAAMIFDPMTGKKGAARLRNDNGKTEVYLQMEPGQSLILKTFSNKVIKEEPWLYLEPASAVQPIAVDRKWSLEFVESTPEIEGVFDIDRLVSWTELPVDEARINSGTARYRTEINLPSLKRTDEWIMDLGALYESAKVRINGRDAGTVFAVPYTLRVGEFLKKGTNVIEVEVTNLPANRIADYDRREVPWRKFKDTNIVNIQYKKQSYADTPVLPSGLVGPVTLYPMTKKF